MLGFTMKAAFCLILYIQNQHVYLKFYTFDKICVNLIVKSIILINLLILTKHGYSLLFISMVIILLTGHKFACATYRIQI